MPPSADAAVGVELQKVARLQVLFGHQSVGAGILHGLARLSTQHPDAGLRIVPLLPTPVGPGFGHFLIGENGKPVSKIAHFDHLLSGPAGDWASVAFFKFCYVDFSASTDVPALFDCYRRAHEARRAAHPHKTFVHVTAPLTRRSRGSLGRLWSGGRSADGNDVNVVRTAYNNLIRQAYAGREPIFDLARLESAGRVVSIHEERAVENLSPSYSADGGHLNSAGELELARALVQCLAALPLDDRPVEVLQRVGD